MSFTPGAGTRFLLSTDSSGTISPSGPLSIAGGTATANAPVLNATQTWNNAAVTFTGWRLNVTDTASNAASLLLDLQVGGVSQFRVTKTGKALAEDQTSGPIYSFAQAPSTGIGRIANDLVMYSGLTPTARLFGNNFSVDSANAIGFCSGAVNATTADALIFRDAANTLAQRNGVNAQTFRVYRTFTDASNYERLEISSDATAHKIVGQRAGTGTNRSLYLEGGGNALGLGIVPFGGVNWTISGGHLLAGTDNAYDIGAVGASRPRNVFWAGYQEMSEMAAPAAPAANSVRIYAEDNGSGKTRLMALFATGAAQQIAIEP